jgi:NitT/TauT family transport system substrate-binding protein
VISGAADIGIAAGTFGAMGSFAKGAPVRVIGATMTGGNDLFWYVPSGSPIRSIADAAGRTVGYSTSGSSTHQTVLAFGKHFHVDLKPVAVGGPPSAFTQVMSGQVDVGWAVLPFGIQALDEGRIRIIAKASDIPRFRDQTIRVVLANASALNARRDVFVRYMRAYREALDWMYADPAAANGYAKLASIPAEAARRVIELSPREDFDPDRFGGLDSLMSDALQFKFLAAPLTKDQLGELIQIPFR